MTFGQNLKEARKDRGLTGPELAEASGVQAKTIYRYERDEHEPPFGIALALADALGMSLDELAGRTPPPPALPLEMTEGAVDGPTRIELLIGRRRFVWTATQA